MAATREYDVVVVGCGMAGLAAGVRVAERGATVAVLEKAPEEHRGGHTRFTESFRVPSTDADLASRGYEFAVPDYSREDFYDDIMAQTSDRADPDLARRLVDEAGATVEWLTDRGVEWDMEPLHVGYTAARTWFDGEELVDTLVAAAEDAGADVFYTTAARAIRQTDERRVAGVEAVSADDRLVSADGDGGAGADAEATASAGVEDAQVTLAAEAVVVAGGAYESSPEKRTRYYGPSYDAMTVRGSRYNTGEAIEMMLDVGARPVGQWGGAHMALIDAAAPDVEGGTNRIDGYQYCLLVNREGERFVDEGEDARAHTYAKFGRRIFEQPGHVAYIVADATLAEYLRPTGPSDATTADSVADLLAELGCEKPEVGAATVRAFNEACDPDRDAFDPDVLDGNAVTDVDPPKSNWALPLTDPPFTGFAVTGGITFSFGGVETTPDAEVVDTRGRVVPGLYAAGNSVGGLFYDNYPGGTGLTNAAVFGRIAGELAADRATDGSA